MQTSLLTSLGVGQCVEHPLGAVSSNEISVEAFRNTLRTLVVWAAEERVHGLQHFMERLDHAIMRGTLHRASGQCSREGAMQLREQGELFLDLTRAFLRLKELQPKMERYIQEALALSLPVQGLTPLEIAMRSEKVYRVIDAARYGLGPIRQRSAILIRNEFGRINHGFDEAADALFGLIAHQRHPSLVELEVLKRERDIFFSNLRARDTRINNIIVLTERSIREIKKKLAGKCLAIPVPT